MTGDGTSVFLGGRYEDGRPLLWKIDTASETVTKLTIAESLRKAGLGEYHVIGDVQFAAGRLWLSMGRRNKDGSIIECKAADLSVDVVPLPPYVDIGWNNALLKEMLTDSGNILTVATGVKGSPLLWIMDASTREWTSVALKPGKRGAATTGVVGRPGEWWGRSASGGLVRVDGGDVTWIRPPEGFRASSMNPGFLADRLILLWGRVSGRGMVPAVYDAEGERWIVADPPREVKSLPGTEGAFFRGRRDAWMVDGYTLYRIPADDLLNLVESAGPASALGEYFAGPWSVMKIEEFEMISQAKVRESQLLGVAIVKTEDALLHDSREGAPADAVALGEGVFLYDWLDEGDRSGALRGAPVSGVPLPYREPKNLDPWIRVRLKEGGGGWMEAKNLAPWRIVTVGARAVSSPLTVYLGPGAETAQKRVVETVDPALLVELREYAGRSEMAAPELWAKLNGIRDGSTYLSGWVPADKLEFDFVQLQREAVRHWANMRSSVVWKGGSSEHEKAGKLLEKMAKEYEGMTFMHPGIFDGGGPRVCDAGTQALFDLAESYAFWKEPEKALAIYERLEKEPKEKVGYEGDVPAMAALRRARLLYLSFEDYEGALKVYRQVVTRYGGRFWPNGMYGLGDAGALYRIREIYREKLNSPEGWVEEYGRLEKTVTDPGLQETLRSLRPEG